MIIKIINKKHKFPKILHEWYDVQIIYNIKINKQLGT